jgi:putative phosphotransacetylase
MYRIPIGVSARHAHVCEQHARILFGHDLTVLRPLSQPGQFAAEETVRVVTKKASFDRVRVLGPARNMTQVEISRTDAIALGIDAPLRLSGDIADSPGVTLIGPVGTVVLTEGVIVAARHVHVPPDVAVQWGVQHGSRVRMRLGMDRALVLDEIVVRIDAQFALELHIDTDEANASGVKTGDIAIVQ